MGPIVEQVQVSRGELTARLAELLRDNPLLARVAGECKTLSWDQNEILIAMLMTAVASNASLQKRLTELEISLSREELRA